MHKYSEFLPGFRYSTKNNNKNKNMTSLIKQNVLPDTISEVHDKSKISGWKAIQKHLKIIIVKKNTHHHSLGSECENIFN